MAGNEVLQHHESDDRGGLDGTGSLPVAVQALARLLSRRSPGRPS